MNAALTPRHRRFIGRLLMCLFLGTLSTVALAWSLQLMPRRWASTFQARQIERGTEVVDGFIVSLGRSRHPIVQSETWSIRDPSDGAWGALWERKKAARIIEIGGEAYDREAESVGFAGGLGAPSVDPFTSAARIDDLASRGIPKSILDGAPDPGGSTITVWSYGWPFPALAFTSRTWFEILAANNQGVPTSTQVRISFRGAIQLADPRGPGFSGEGRLLPIHPQFPGLLIDILFFTAVWLLMLVAPDALRRRYRLRRGRCPRCGYDLRATPGSPCPECGSEPPAPKKTGIIPV